MKAQILKLVEEAEHGLTSKDLAIKLRCPRATICRRLAEMKAEGTIGSTGEYRADAAVMTASQQRSLVLDNPLFQAATHATPSTERQIS